MEKFGFSGLWKHGVSSFLAAGLLVADAVLSYLGTVQLPTWAHALVGVGVVLLAAYKGKAQPAPAP